MRPIELPDLPPDAIEELAILSWLNPSEMLWRDFRRNVTHCELFESLKALVAATLDYFRRCNAQPTRVLSIIGSHAA